MPKTEQNTFDVIIVGAGPAGAAAGLYAARNGLKALMVDKENFPRDKICGDALSGKSVAVLRELDLLEKTQNLPGAHIQSIVFSSPDHALGAARAVGLPDLGGHEQGPGSHAGQGAAGSWVWLTAES